MMEYLLLAVMNAHPRQEVAILQATLIPTTGWLVIYEAGDEVRCGFVMEQKASVAFEWSHKLRSITRRANRTFRKQKAKS